MKGKRMKLKLVALAILCLCLASVVSSTRAQSPIVPPEIPGRGVYIPFPVDIKLDGKLDDWKDIPLIKVDHGSLPSKDPAEDGSFSFALAAKDEMLFLTMSVVDKNIITGTHGTDFWNEDSLE